jgi:F420-dependent oxidoreductase-like protein
VTPFFAYHMPSFTFPGVTDDALFDHAAGLAQAAEDAGFEMVTVMDHFYQIPVAGAETEPMLEAYSALAGLAARTRRARLGTLVTGVTYRNPALLAKVVTTLDVISQGRALLGIGAAWHQGEHEGYGIDFPPLGERMDRLDEALTICRLMFAEERPSFEGRHYRIDRALNCPRPLQPGGPRILVGGGGERRTLRLVARHADMSHWFGSLDDLRRKTEVLERHCEAEGRDPSTITRTITAPVVPVEDVRTAGPVLERVPPPMREGMAVVPPAEAAERLQPYLDAGFSGFFLSNATLPTPESLAPAAELIRLVSRG